MNTRLILAALALLASFHVDAASFDCAKSRSRLEVLICSDPVLSGLDEQLAGSYRAALAKGSDRKTLVRWQREWLGSAALSDCRDAICLSRQFKARIQVLGRVAPEESGGWTGTFIRVLNGKDDESAQLLLVRLDGGQVSVSGVAYWVGANAGQVNSGEMNGMAKIDGARATFSEDGCEAVLALVRGKLSVVSESSCGGLNVSFGGAYRRK